jgi:hypothetical protein
VAAVRLCYKELLKIDVYVKSFPPRRETGTRKMLDCFKKQDAGLQRYDNEAVFFTRPYRLRQKTETN